MPIATRDQIPNFAAELPQVRAGTSGAGAFVAVQTSPQPEVPDAQRRQHRGAATSRFLESEKSSSVTLPTFAWRHWRIGRGVPCEPFDVPKV
jgi:hypothetical protein